MAENFVALYAESIYGPDATFMLASLQYAKRQYLKARETLQSLAKKPNYPYASDVADYLRDIEHDLAIQRDP